MTTKRAHEIVSPLRWLVADVGDVLVTTHPDQQFVALAALTGQTAEQLKIRFQATPLLDDLEAGRIDTEAFLAAYSHAIGRHLTTDSFRQAWLEVIGRPVRPVLATLAAVARRCSIALASNTSDLHWAQIEQQLAPFALPYTPCLSYQIGARKPSVAFFTQLVDQLGCDPQEALFIDDQLDNVLAARRAGFQIYRHTSPQATARVLRHIATLLRPCL